MSIAMPSPSGTNRNAMFLPEGRGFGRCGPIAGTERLPADAAYDSRHPQLGYDAAPPTDAGEVTATKVLEFLSSKLSASDLLHVARMLTSTPIVPRTAGLNEFAEDAAKADFFDRYPQARRIKREPDYRGASPPRAAQCYEDDFLSRYPEARRIKRA